MSDGLVDIHVHLLAAIDDGPRKWDDSLAMCRFAVEEGTGYAVGMSHQSERWTVTPDEIRAACGELRSRLQAESIPLQVFPSAEVMATYDLVEQWDRGQLLSIADRKRHLLIEMPNGIFVDLRSVARSLRNRGVSVVLAHPERHPELLLDVGKLEELIALGCLVQVSTSSVTDPRDTSSSKALRDWFQRGCVHLIGSDGHSPRKRKPHMAKAVAQIREWVGPEIANMICRNNGLAVLRGEEIKPPIPTRQKSWWPLRLFGVATGS